MNATHPPALPHGDIEQLGPGLYWVQGSIKMGPGMRVTRNMAVVETDGALTLLNAVRLDAAGEAALTALGTITHVVKLGFFHGRDCGYYCDKFDAKYWALPDGTRDADPTAHESLTADNLPIPDATLFAFESTRKPECALLVQRGNGLLITCDSVQNWPDTKRCSVPAKLVTRAMGFTKRQPQIGGPWRKYMTPKDGSLRGDFDRLADLEFDQLVSAHGAPLRSGANTALRATIGAIFS